MVSWYLPAVSNSLACFSQSWACAMLCIIVCFGAMIFLCRNLIIRLQFFLCRKDKYKAHSVLKFFQKICPKYLTKLLFSRVLSKSGLKTAKVPLYKLQVAASQAEKRIRSKHASTAKQSVKEWAKKL
jgi:hypothetical protein